MTARSGTALTRAHRMRASLAASRYLNAPESSERPAQCGNRGGHSVPVACCDLAVTSVKNAQVNLLIMKPGIIKGDDLARSASWLFLQQGGGYITIPVPAFGDVKCPLNHHLQPASCRRCHCRCDNAACVFLTSSFSSSVCSAARALACDEMGSDS